MVTLLFPVLLIVTVFELLVPTSTLPKLKFAALGVSWSVCPVPVSAIVVGEFVAVLTTDTLPKTVPAVTGEKITVKLALWPTAKVIGTAKPPAANSVPDTLTCEMLTLLLPVFVSTTDCELLPPTSTLPRFKDVALGKSKYVGVVEEELAPVPDTAIELVFCDHRESETLILP